MKKLFTILIACALVASLSVSAFAAEVSSDSQTATGSPAVAETSTAQGSKIAKLRAEIGGKRQQLSSLLSENQQLHAACIKALNGYNQGSGKITDEQAAEIRTMLENVKSMFAAQQYSHDSMSSLENAAKAAVQSGDSNAAVGAYNEILKALNQRYSASSEANSVLTGIRQIIGVPEA